MTAGEGEDSELHAGPHLLFAVLVRDARDAKAQQLLSLVEHLHQRWGAELRQRLLETRLSRGDHPTPTDTSRKRAGTVP